MPRGWPRRELSSPRTSPTESFGAEIVSFTIGSSSAGEASAIASLKPIEAQILKAISEESTEWCWPSSRRADVVIG